MRCTVFEIHTLTLEIGLGGAVRNLIGKLMATLLVLDIIFITITFGVQKLRV